MNKIVEQNVKDLASIGVKVNSSKSDKVEIFDDLLGNKSAKININGISKHIYSKYNAKEVAKIQISSLDLLDRNILVVFGSGLLYEVKEVASKWKRKGYVLLVEPNKEIFDELIKNSQHTLISNDYDLNVIFTEGKDEKQIFTELNEKIQVAQFYPITTYANVAYKQLFKEDYLNTLKAIRDFTGAMNMNINTAITFDKLLNKNYNDFLYKLYESGTIINTLKNKFDGFPAVVVSAGPSLAKNMHLLKEMQGKIVIIALYVTYQKLVDNGINPDFVISVDPRQPLAQKHKEEGYTSNLIVSVGGNIEIADANKGTNFLFTSMESESMQEFFDIDGEKSDIIYSGGTVANSAFDFAYYLGCRNIIVIGQDLAYGSDGVTHVEGAESIKVDVSGRKMLDVKGYYGDTVHADELFNVYRLWFEDYAIRKPECRGINATEGGVYIQGFEHISLQEALKKYVSEKTFDINNVINKVNRKNNQELEEGIKKYQKIYDIFKESIELNRKAYKAALKLEEMYKRGNLTTRERDKQLKHMNRFDKFYEKNTEYFNFIRYMIDTANIYQLDGYPLELSMDEVIIQQNIKLYSGFYESVNNGGYYLEKTIEKLKTLQEERNGVQ